MTATSCGVDFETGLAVGAWFPTVWVITSCGGFGPASFELKMALFEFALVIMSEIGTLPVIRAGSSVISL